MDRLFHFFVRYVDRIDHAAIKRRIAAILCMALLLSAPATPGAADSGCGWFNTACKNANAINDYLETLANLSLPDSANAPVGDASRTFYSGDGADRQSCFYQNYRASGPILTLAGFAPNAETIWPGSIIQGASLVSNRLSPLPLAHSGMYLTVQAINKTQTSNTSYRTFVANPTAGTVTDAIAKLVNSNLASIQPADIAYTADETFSKEQTAERLGARYEWLSGSVQASLSNEDYKERGHVVVQVVQKYFTVAQEPPPTPAEEFETHAVTVDGVRTGLSGLPGPNPAVYVKSVTYGRTAYILLSSSVDSHRLKTAVDASFSGLTSGGSLSGSTDDQSIVKDSHKEIFVQGGSGAAAAALINAGIAGIPDWIKAGADFSATSPGSPISFEASYLKRGFASAGSSFTTDYTLKPCTPSPQKIVAVQRALTIDDDKDFHNVIGDVWTLQDGGSSVVIASTPQQGGEIKWESGPGYDSPQVRLSRPVPINQCHNIIADLHQSGDNGKTSGTATYYAFTDDGKTLTVVNAQGFTLENESHATWRFNC